jgi:hypothetical protein
MGFLQKICYRIECKSMSGSVEEQHNLTVALMENRKVLKTDTVVLCIMMLLNKTCFNSYVNSKYANFL